MPLIRSPKATAQKPAKHRKRSAANQGSHPAKRTKRARKPTREIPVAAAAACAGVSTLAPAHQVTTAAILAKKQDAGITKAPSQAAQCASRMLTGLNSTQPLDIMPKPQATAWATAAAAQKPKDPSLPNFDDDYDEELSGILGGLEELNIDRCAHDRDCGACDPVKLFQNR